MRLDWCFDKPRLDSNLHRPDTHLSLSVTLRVVCRRHLTPNTVSFHHLLPKSTSELRITVGDDGFWVAKDFENVVEEVKATRVRDIFLTSFEGKAFSKADRSDQGQVDKPFKFKVSEPFPLMAANPAPGTFRRPWYRDLRVDATDEVSTVNVENTGLHAAIRRAKADAGNECYSWLRGMW